MPSIDDGSLFIVLSSPQERKYQFSTTPAITVPDVLKIRHANGYEYLEDKDGNQTVIAPGWLYMTATPNSWVFRP